MRAAARERLCEAMLELVSSQGYDATTVEEVVERAGVSRREFDSLFSSKEECAMAVFDAFLKDFEEATRRAYDSEPEWRDSIRAAGYAAAIWINSHRREVRFGTVEMLWAGEMAQARREIGFQNFVGMIDAGRESCEDPDSVPPFTAEGVIGSFAEMLTKRAKRGEYDPYPLVPELMYRAVLPYLGEDAAIEELALPPPPRASNGE
jgi:AcrR family transcriptional regulator